LQTNPSSPARQILRLILALAMVFAGLAHFFDAATFVAMVPPMLPAPLLLVYISGVAELAGGLGLLSPWPQLRRAASFGLIALYVAVFPANVHMALDGVPFGGRVVPVWALWARLPLQALFIAWAYYVGKSSPSPSRVAAAADKTSK
jgi:uncharacterized membrane protein